ncbi:MAG: hypothetical protein AVO38_08300 [delta proteobacterium ML8_D]|nr:MAG: hypothetical protein AVO38_08300 [delta proteobacterium ML8_D]
MKTNTSEAVPNSPNSLKGFFQTFSIYSLVKESYKKSSNCSDCSGKVTRIEKKLCSKCRYFSVGPGVEGGEISWCGPWRQENGDERFFNIAGLNVCPLKVKYETKTEKIIEQNCQEYETISI